MNKDAHKRYRRQVHATILDTPDKDFSAMEAYRAIGHGYPTAVYKCLEELVEAGLATRTRQGDPSERRYRARGTKAKPSHAVAEALKGATARVEEYLRQYGRQDTTGNVIHRVWTDPDTIQADLTVADLKTISTLATAPRLTNSEAEELHSILRGMLSSAGSLDGQFNREDMEKAVAITSRLVDG
jgi:hypothetical protein